MAAPFWQAGTLYLPGDLVQPITQPAPNNPQVINGGFEAGATGWTFSGDAAYSTTGGYGSARCVVLPGNKPDGAALNNAQLVVPAGAQLTATCLIQQGASVAGATAGWAEIRWYDSLNTLLQTDKGNAVDSGSGGAWHPSTIVATAPASAAYARAAIHLTSVADHNHEIFGDNLNVSGATAGLPDGLVYKAVQTESGTSGSSEPAWPGILGQQVIDNEVIWEAVTTSRVTWTASPRYVSGATEPAWPTDIGSLVQDNTINWKAISRRVEDEKCPNSKVVAIVAAKVFAADKDIVKFSATANPLDWSTADDAGYLPTGLQQANANDMAVLQQYRANLVALNASSFQNWQVDPDPASMAILDQMDGIGSVWPRAAVPVANDLFYLAALGVRTVGIANAAENLAAGDVGAPVDIMIQESLRVAERNESKVLGAYYPSAGQYWLSFSDYPPAPLSILGNLPDGLVGSAIPPFKYTVVGGVKPYGAITLLNGTLPPGLTLTVDGAISGTPTAQGVYAWTVGVQDADGNSASQNDGAVFADPATVNTIPVVVKLLSGVTGGGASGLASEQLKNSPLNSSINARVGDWAIIHVRAWASPTPAVPPETRCLIYQGNNQTGLLFHDTGWHGNEARQSAMQTALNSAGLGQYGGPIKHEDLVILNNENNYFYQSTPFAYEAAIANVYSSRLVIYRSGPQLNTNMFIQYPNPALIPAGAVIIPGLPGYYVTPAGTIYRVMWNNRAVAQT
jgi:hypothetical protein